MKPHLINGRLAASAVLALCTTAATTAVAATAIQVGAFSQPARVDAAVQALSSAGYPVTTQKVARSGTELTRVLVGPYASAGATAALAELHRAGWSGFLVKTTDTPMEKRDEPIRLAAQSIGGELPGSRDALFADEPELAKKEIVPMKETAKEALFGDDLDMPMKDGAKNESSASSSWKGFLRGEAARAITGPAHWTKMLARAELGKQGTLGGDVKWKLSARMDYDAAYDHYTYYPAEVRNDQRANFSLRETYLDIGAGEWDFRLGRQHVVWGEMVGLFFADVVSAKDMREFILPEFDVLRIPQWAARAEYFKDDFHAELLWVPVVTYDETGKPGAEFFPYAPPAPAGYATEYRNEVRPSRNLDNTNYGVRLSTLKNGWDVSGFYYRSMDAAPTFYRDIVTVPQNTFIYEARHDRIEQLGGTVAKDLGDMVLKGEIVYTHGRQFNVTRLTETDGVVPQNTLDWVAGLDFNLPEETRLNVQLFQRVFFKHDADIIPAKHEDGFSVLLNSKLTHNLEAQALLISSLNRSDWLFRPSLAWTMEKNWRLMFGVDIFSGPPLGMFGRFDNQDRVYTEVRYSF